MSLSLEKVDFERLINDQGRSVIFSRIIAGVENTVTVKAQVRRSRNDPSSTDLTGGMIEDGFIVICSTKEMENAGWPLPPKTGDRCSFDGEYHMIRSVYQLYLSETLTGFRVQVSG